jgi:formimidoylglutamase
MKYGDVANYLFPYGKYFADPRHPSFWDSVLGPQDVDKADAVLIGVPFDGGTQRHVGMHLGPQGIRKGMAYFRNFSVELEIEMGNYPKLADIGDIDCDLHSYERTFERLDQVLGAVVDAGLVPICLGGDHSITYQAMKTLCARTGKRTGLLWFDTHPDTFTDYRGDRYHCGCPLYYILTEFGNYIRPENVVQIGLHGFFNSANTYQNAKKLGYHIVGAEEVHMRGIDAVMKEALTQASDGTEQFYVTIDIDVLDAIYAPGTQVPTPGGLTSSQLFKAIRMAAIHGCRAMDVCEVAPAVDIADITVKTAGSLVLEFLAGMAYRHMRT